MVQWAAIFPEKLSQTLSTIEYWVTSIFLVLCLLTIGPWLIFLVYDLLLYLFRTVAYEVPVIGGRARGKDRPRAPSLKERPSGDPRVLGIGVPGATYLEGEDTAVERRHDEERAQLLGDNDNEDKNDGTNDHKENDNENAHPVQPEVWHADTALGKFGFAQQGDIDEQDGGRPQRLFSVGGQDEMDSWTEVNARHRMGFKEDDEPGG